MRLLNFSGSTFYNDGFDMGNAEMGKISLFLFNGKGEAQNAQ